MDYSCKCPGCSRAHIYFSHEIGTTAYCKHCGKELHLQADTARVVRDVVWATIVGAFMLMGMLAFTFRLNRYVWE